MSGSGESAGPVEASVTLHSSWKGIVLSLVGALLVFVFGLSLTLTSGGEAIPIAVLLLGTLFLATMLFDYPVASTFTADSVCRRALLRHHTIHWDKVDQLTRSRPGLSGMRSLTPGGLAAKVGRRRYLLVDQSESLGEFEALGEVLKARYVTLGVDEMIPPHVEVDPTWTYRRRRWEPEP